MKDYRKKKRAQRFFSSKLGRLLVLVLLGVLVFPVFRIYLKSKQANEMSEGVGQELAELQIKKDFLVAEIARLKTEEGKEEEARKKFNISKPDEELVVITDKREASTSDKENGEGFVNGLWQKVKNIF